jgi:D-alanyl-D-alanine carboxypeptidase
MTNIPELNEQTTNSTESNVPHAVPVGQQLILLVLILFLIFGSTITPKVIAFIEKSKTSIPALSTHADTLAAATPTPSSAESPAPFSAVTIRGRAAFVWDMQRQKVLFKKNENEQLPLASVTKLMTALVAAELLEKNASVPIEAAAIRQDGDSGLSSGQIFSTASLTDLVLMASSNDGALALATAAGRQLSEEHSAESFVHAMNIRAKEIGLSNTYFKNPTGLDISSSEGGAYGSARDMAFLMEYIVKNEPDILTLTREEEARVYSKTGEYHDAENTNYYIDKIPELIGSKTGYTDLAGGNLVIAFNAGLNRPIVISVLGSTQQERFIDIVTLADEVRRVLSVENK